MSSPASLKDVSDNDATKMLQVVMSEMNDLRMDFRRTVYQMTNEKEQLEVAYARRHSDQDYIRCRRNFDKFKLAIDNKEAINNVRQAYELFQESLARASAFNLPENRLVILKDISLLADRLLSEFLQNNSN